MKRIGYHQYGFLSWKNWTKKQRETKGLFSCLSKPVNTWAILATENDESRHSEKDNDMLVNAAKKILISLVFFVKSKCWWLNRKEPEKMMRPKEWYWEWEELTVFLFFENLLLLIVSKTKIDVLLFISPCWLQSSLYNSSRRDGYCNTSPQHHNPLLVDLDWFTSISFINHQYFHHKSPQIPNINFEWTTNKVFADFRNPRLYPKKQTFKSCVS